MKILLATVLIAIAAAAQAARLTIHAGESWIFKVKDGQPADRAQGRADRQAGQGRSYGAVGHRDGEAGYAAAKAGRG